MSAQSKEIAILPLIAKHYGITFFVLDPQGKIKSTYSADEETNRYLFDFSNLVDQLITLFGQNLAPQIISSKLNQIWVGIPIHHAEQITEVIVAGPVFTSQTARDIMLDYAQSYNIEFQPREKMLTSLAKTPIYSYEELTIPLSVIHQLLMGEDLDCTNIPITGLSKEQEISFLNEIFPALMEDTIESASTDPAFEFQQHYMDCIRHGQVEKLKRLLKNVPPEAIRLANFSESPIRRQKDMFLMGLSLSAHAAIKGGLNSEVGFNLVDQYTLKVETMMSMLPILTLNRDMMFDFANRVNKLKQTRQYSKTINDCCNYIHSHVYDSLRVPDIAAYIGLNANYISRKFKEETGQSISEYIRRAKITEAKSLLKFSSMSLSEISEHLAFSSQSFFTATFRKETGLTPRQFREEGGGEGLSDTPF
ncbi:MAG: helix-turn-helix domain-containing protein [Anaerolineaceae bacterium]|nr:helix-turn-helix domain-containing protein [Anaerolineaceae bacterium]